MAASALRAKNKGPIEYNGASRGEAVLVGVPRDVLGEVGHPQVDLAAGLRGAQPSEVHLVRSPLVALGVGGVGVGAHSGGRVVVGLVGLAAEAAEAAQVGGGYSRRRKVRRRDSSGASRGVCPEEDDPRPAAEGEEERRLPAHLPGS